MTSRIKERPIFIIGVHRSGTTLLRYMLNSHPRIYIPPESDFIPRFFQRRPDAPMRTKQASRILDTIFDSYRFVNEWQADRPDAETFVENLQDLTPSVFLDALYREYASQQGAVRWGDKTPIYTSYVDLVSEIFPRAQFIHIIRDGRDVALSMLEKWSRKEFHIDIYYAVQSWKKRLYQAFASSFSLDSDQYYELRYEQLVIDPVPLLKEICEYLKEEYVAEMAEPHHLGRERISPSGFHAAIRQPPNDKRVARWRREMTVQDQRLIQAVAGDLLEKLGYKTIDLGKMTYGELVRFAGLRTKYTLFQAGRRLLQSVGIFYPN